MTTRQMAKLVDLQIEVMAARDHAARLENERASERQIDAAIRRYHYLLADQVALQATIRSAGGNA